MVMTVAFVSSSFVEVFENHKEWYPSFFPDSRLSGLTWFDCLYLMVITMTTIGYGAHRDASPCLSLGARVLHC